MQPVDSVNAASDLMLLDSRAKRRKAAIAYGERKIMSDAGHFGHGKIGLVATLAFLAIAETQAYSQVGAVNSGAVSQGAALADSDPVLRLEELTEANHEALLLKDDARSIVIAYSSLEASAAQTELLTMMLRESHPYKGVINFYRLDQARHPVVWHDVKKGAAWTTGPYFLLVNASPPMIGTIVEARNGVDSPLHQISQERLKAEIVRFFKVQLPVSHVSVSDIAEKVSAPALPTFIMAYRSKGPKYDRNGFQPFVYESQLYAGRVNFVMVDLDESDVSYKLGIKMPKQDDTYFVVYNPTARNGAMIFDPALSTKNMEEAIRQYFGPGHEPAQVVK